MQDSKSKGAEPVRWKVVSRREIADCRVFTIKRHRCRIENGVREGDFYVIDAPDWVVILAVTPPPREEFVMVRQFRYGCEDFFMEFPAGVMEAGEDAVTAGLRELREETGYDAEKAHLIGRVKPNPALQNNTCHFVLAEGARPTSETQWDEHERIEVCLLRAEEVRQRTLDGRIDHALAINALYFFDAYRAERSKA